MLLEADAGVWVVYSEDLESLSLALHQEFLDNYSPVDKIASNYLE